MVEMQIGRRNVVILAAIMAAIVSLIVVGSIQGTQERELMERSFVTLGRFLDAVAVYKLHEERRITESYVTPHSADEIRAYYDQRFHETSWQGPGPTWNEGDFSMRCYIDPTGRITAKLGTRSVPLTGSYVSSIEVTRNGCAQGQQ